MKKILIFVFSLMIVPIIAKADMGAPSFYEYEAIVTVKGGIKKSNSNCKIDIPYGEVLTVYYESDNYAEIYYNEESCHIKKEYLTPKDISFDDLLSTLEKELALFEGNSITLYNGPSKVFGIKEENLKIPFGTIVDYYHFNDTFSYISYNGVSGWVYICGTNEMCPYGEVQSEFALDMDLNILTFTDSKIIGLDGNVIGEVPRNTTLPGEYEGKYTYVRYNGKLGYVDGISDYEDNYIKDDRQIIALKDMKITFNGKTMTVKKGATMDIKYRANDYSYDDNDNLEYRYYKYFVDDGTNYGWINDISSNESFAILLNNEYTITLSGDVTLYSDMDCKKVAGTLSKNSEISSKYYRYNELDEDNTIQEKPLYNTMIYIESSNNSGWVKLTNDDFLVEEIIDPNNDIKPNPNPEPVQPGNSSEAEHYVSSRELTLYSVLGAFVGALVTVVIIKLVNKKKETE